MKKEIPIILWLLIASLLTSCQLTATPTAQPATATVAPPTATALPPTATPTPALPAFLQQPSDTIRVMNYNVNWDSIFPPDDPNNHGLRLYDRHEAFARILRAVQPDIICLQEINPNRDPAQVADMLEGILAPVDTRTWQGHIGQNNLIAAPYDLKMTADAAIHENRTLTRGHALALVDLPDSAYPDLYLVCAHFKSSGGNINVQLREHHADALVNWIRDIKTEGGKIDLPDNTPFIIMGDFNVYDTDPHRHLNTLVTGDIINEDRYGPDIQPDWDGTALTNALPTHNGQGDAIWTWRDDSDPFNPGPLDHIIYSDSVIRVENSFVLNTRIMDEATLDAAGLQADDVMVNPETGNYDHLPMVVDISFKKQ